MRNLYGLERLGAVQAGAWYYPQHDAIGSVRQWTDALGAVVGMQGYSPYGEPLTPLGPPPAPWGFTGEWQDPAGLAFLRARWYNPAFGRFTQVDPVPGILTLPVTRHPYAYAVDCPLRYTDPSGRNVPVPHYWYSNRKIADMSDWPEWAKTAAQVVGFLLGLHVNREQNTIATPSAVSHN